MQFAKCLFCGMTPMVVPIRVFYNTTITATPMHRMECRCGAVGKCRSTEEKAIEDWAGWQAKVET